MVKVESIYYPEGIEPGNEEQLHEYREHRLLLVAESIFRDVREIVNDVLGDPGSSPMRIAAARNLAESYRASVIKLAFSEPNGTNRGTVAWDHRGRKMWDTRENES